MRAVESQEVKCEVRVGYQGLKILKIVDEGYEVTEDDIKTNKVLVELDSSDLQKQITQQDIQYESAAAALLRPAALVPLSVGAFLLLSPIILFPSAGVLSTGGAILTSVIAGRVWARRSRQSGNFLLALGLGIASGALWTDWSRVTNALFVLGGLIVAALGVGGRRSKDSATG